MIDINDFLEFGLINTQGLFAENVFAGFESGDDLSGMEVVTSGNNDGVDFGIVEYLSFVCCCIVEVKLMRHMLGTNSRSRTNTNKFDSLDFFHRGQKSAFGEFTGAQKANPDRMADGG